MYLTFWIGVELLIKLNIVLQLSEFDIINFNDHGI